MSKTILLVDDGFLNRRYMAALLGRKGYTILEASDGAEALALIRAERPDLVITDILMPTMDGYELVRQLRGNPDFATTPVIFYTGAYDPEEVRRLTNAGCVFHLLIKPAGIDVILRHIDAALDNTLPPGSQVELEEFDREHRRLLTDKLAQKVSELEQEVEERKRSEDALKASEQRFRELAENIREVFWIGTPDAGQILYVSPAYELIWGRSCESLHQQPLSWAEAIHPDDRAHALDLLAVLESGGFDVEYRIVRPDDSIRWIHARGFPIRNTAGEVYRIAGIAEDITERKQSERALRASEQFLQLVMDNIPLSIFWKDIHAAYQGCNRSYAQMMGVGAPAEILGKRDEDLCGKHAKSDLFRESDRLVMDMDAPILHMVEPVTRADGKQIQADVSKLPLHDEEGRVVGVLGTLEDITERVLSQEQLKSQFERLTAMRAIDTAILGSLDLRMTLHLILEQVIAGLDILAGRILRLSSHSHMLEVAAGRGFSTSDAAQAGMRIGEGHAGRAALERRPVSVLNLNEAEEIFLDRDLIEAEGFVEYHAVPLIAKGIVNGVLEVFSRELRSRDADWHEFLETLAGQAAIAIDNATLFTDLQRSNLELVLAYDATLEGWVKALDLRDKETEGHTLRVTQMTVRLAKAMGLGEAELAHVRRGALLHDIGKLGIPDTILLKQGPLTEEEWVIMRRHPEYAHGWLWPIAFLRPASDIPYCHHEKWDGTGYPRGLKAEQIPLAARIFAVADVWDALRSDRPYREGWPDEKVCNHIRSQSGTHFDPRVVQAFLDVIVPATKGTET